MAAMKALSRFNNKMDAHMAAQFLISHGIAAEVRGSREYASHVLGGDAGLFELLVEEGREQEALGLLKELDVKSAFDRTEGGAGRHLKRAVVFAVMAAVVLPVVFNYASLKNLMAF